MGDIKLRSDCSRGSKLQKIVLNDFRGRGNIEGLRYLKESDGIGDDMELENNDDKFNIEKQIPLIAWHMNKTPPA